MNCDLTITGNQKNSIDTRGVTWSHCDFREVRFVRLIESRFIDCTFQHCVIPDERDTAFFFRCLFINCGNMTLVGPVFIDCGQE